VGYKGSSEPRDYALLSDDQLRSALRFAAKRLRSVQADHVALVRAYRDEIAAMRRLLFDRLITMDARVSAKQRREAHRVMKRRGMSPSEMSILIRAITRGRTDQLDGLTEIEGMALLLHLKREE